MPDREPERRSQNERTAATIARLLEATMTAIVELGYSRATVREICARAGVSQGGLVPPLPDAQGPPGGDPRRDPQPPDRGDGRGGVEADPHAAIARMRDVINSPDTTVWLELCRRRAH